VDCPGGGVSCIVGEGIELVEGILGIGCSGLGSTMVVKRRLKGVLDGELLFRSHRR
jgi:hypothetical protein